MQYRREIDGLRTIAVLPVLLSHAGLPGFGGGFVGVDVFFVISGYLITGLILADLDAARFSLVKFYERRARRILPALFLVMVACLIVGWPLMSADAYQNLGQSVVATTLFANNILLLATTGYWALEASFKPLLHTWSLGVEEQYYLLAPLVLMAVTRLSRNRVRPVLAGLGVISFLACLWSAQHAPTADFYLLHTRAWELAVGGWLAAGQPVRPVRGADALSFLGLVLILATVVLLPPGSPSPSWMILPVVAGTALVLQFAHDGWCQKLLASPPVAGLGLISYSLYLWHQPLFAFLRVASPLTPPAWQFGLMILLALPLAWLTWRFVERPFRNLHQMSGRQVAMVLAPLGVILVLIGAAIQLGGGLPWRFALPAGAPAGAYKAYNMAVFRFRKDAFSPDNPRRLLVIGNSTARDMVNMVGETGRFRGYDIVYRDDIDFCVPATLNTGKLTLLREATLVVLVTGWQASPMCDGQTLAATPLLKDKVIFVGPRDFGANLNPYARLPLDKRRQALAAVTDKVLAREALLQGTSPPELYVSVLAGLSADGRHVPVFDQAGRLLSEDRVHLTQAGALFVGQRVFANPAWSRVEATSLARAGLAP